MSDIDQIVAKIAKLKKDMGPESLRIKHALLRIGTVLEASIKQNIQRQGIVQDGRLLNSIRYQLKGQTLEVGSFGVPYAAMNEFGGRMSRAQVRAMFAAMRKRAHPRAGPKGIVKINKDGTGTWTARPYLRPAIQQQAQFILDRLKELGRPA